MISDRAKSTIHLVLCIVRAVAWLLFTVWTISVILVWAAMFTTAGNTAVQEIDVIAVVLLAVTAAYCVTRAIDQGTRGWL